MKSAVFEVNFCGGLSDITHLSVFKELLMSFASLNKNPVRVVKEGGGGSAQVERYPPPVLLLVTFI